MAVAVMTIRFAVAWEMIGVISTRLKRTVTWIDALPEAGLMALHPPPAGAGYSPPGAFIGGLVSTDAGGFGSGTLNPAVFSGGPALVIGPFGPGSLSRVPSSC